MILNLSLGPSTLGIFLWAAVAGLVIGIPGALRTWAHLRPTRAAQVGVFGQAAPDPF